MTDTVLETPRLRLRLYRRDDEQDVARLFGDELARTFYPDMTDPRSAGRWIEWNLRHYVAFGFGLWVMERRESGGFVGNCGLSRQTVQGKSRLEVGYHVTHAERGNGFATEAARACVDHAFEQTASPTVCSIVVPSNAASRAVAGRVHAGVSEIDDEGRRVLLFVTTREQWGEATVAADRAVAGPQRFT
jgi:RimJ/RimL family protein N-acetyltransferase